MKNHPLTYDDHRQVTLPVGAPLSSMASTAAEEPLWGCPRRAGFHSYAAVQEAGGHS